VRRFAWLFSLPFAAVVVVFALSNRETVVLAFWPLLDGLAMPLYLAVLVPLIAGFFIGSLVQRLRRRRSRQKPLSSPTTGL
jgi:uncharacterized integral membrane protein